MGVLIRAWVKSPIILFSIGDRWEAGVKANVGIEGVTPEEALAHAICRAEGVE